MKLEDLLASSKKTVTPKEIRPMMATLIQEPFSDPNFIFEVKWDGYRTIAEVEKGNVRLYSRNNLNFNEKFPEIKRAFEGFGRDAVFDGEVVALDRSGRSSFQLLQDRLMGVGGELVYYIFDIIYFDGHDVTSWPLLQRKELLKEVFPRAANIKFSDHIEEDGIDFF